MPPPLRAINDPPTVDLDNGTFIGTTDGVSNKYLGIPFALPPTGSLRFRLPVPNNQYNGTHNATQFGMDCPQQRSAGDNALDDMITTDLALMLGLDKAEPRPEGEDCLTINVWTPADAQPGANLSVLVWIFGGGFEVGSPADYDGGKIVNRSIELDQPVIYVSMNYRVTAFGFLASEEVKEAGVGNIGLWDQREALRWIQNYIHAFGGDPSKVTIWGESAGGISVALQMLTNGGDTQGLFRAAVMASGSPIPVGDISNGQIYYDELVRLTGCTGSSDTLECLRRVPYDRLKQAVDMSPGIMSPQSLNLAWLPRADGKFLVEAPQQLVLKGSVARIPFITGDCDDEGTIFSIIPSTTPERVETSKQFETWFTNTYMPTVPEDQLTQVYQVYPDDPSQGSPFGTGNTTFPFPYQFKRMAAIQGDLVFQAPRRFFLEEVSNKQNAWAYLDQRFKSTFLIGPIIGAFHGSDLGDFYSSGILADYLINFVNHLDPKNQTGVDWPRYNSSSPSLLTLSGRHDSISITSDNFRAEEMKLLTNLSLKYPL
ncbi:hypothetical protein CERSUDRAFT_111844 [Gelatoporia subvermispora B]|uniref:Carboxylic ester hydrolase n=1 Tax=Ceriporiopsis subvermispora (strain B) TaxID=914234 RepID=M2R4P3_CERS8|nr:hypothetical protein CERSUDRAFT_111844 [Gelatoporia subvermispora B]